MHNIQYINNSIVIIIKISISAENKKNNENFILNIIFGYLNEMFLFPR